MGGVRGHRRQGGQWKREEEKGIWFQSTAEVCLQKNNSSGEDGEKDKSGFAIGRAGGKEKETLRREGKNKIRLIHRDQGA